MAISRDTSQDVVSSSGSTTSLTLTFPATCTANRLLVAGVGIGAAESAVTGPSGWTKALGAEHNSGTFCVQVWYKIAAGTETNLNFSVSSATSVRAAAYQYSGAATSTPLDKTAVNQSGGSQVATIATGTTATISQADELIVSVVHIAGAGTNITWTNGTELRDDQLFGFAQRIVAATATYSDTASWTSNQFAAAGIATFKAASLTPVSSISVY